MQAEASYSDGFNYNLRNFDADKCDNYTLVNTRLSRVNSVEHREIALAVRNLTDETAVIWQPCVAVTFVTTSELTH